MTKDFIENYVSTKVRLTMIDDSIFEGILWLVNFEDENENEVHSICLDTYQFQFRCEHIKKIETKD
jgi:hypothetical protein